MVSVHQLVVNPWSDTIDVRESHLESSPICHIVRGLVIARFRTKITDFLLLHGHQRCLWRRQKWPSFKIKKLEINSFGAFVGQNPSVSH